MDKALAFQIIGGVVVPLLLGACGSSSNVVTANCDCGATATAAAASVNRTVITKNLGTTLPPLHCAP